MTNLNELKEKSKSIDELILEVLNKKETDYYFDNYSQIIKSDNNNYLVAKHHYNQGNQAEIESDLLFSKLRLLAKHESLNGDWKPQYNDTVYRIYADSSLEISILGELYMYGREIYFRNMDIGFKALKLFGYDNILKMLKNGN
jgi:hypothetical protein